MLATASRRRWIIAAAGVMALIAASAADALATAPGGNGTIAFRRYFDKDQSTGAIFTIGADGTGEQQITNPPAETVDDQPEWAPDGSVIAFTRCPETGLCHVFTVQPDGGGLQPLGPLCAESATERACPDDEGASFSPDSQRLAFVQSSGSIRKDAYTESWIEHSALTIVNRDGSGRHVIYRGAPFSGDLMYPVFSPDGRQLVFERVASSFTLQSLRRAVFVIRTDGTHLRRITPWEESDGDNPDWSPDGKWIVFHSHVDEDDKRSQIFMIHPDGSGRKQITHVRKGSMLGSSSFSPDGRWLTLSQGLASGNLHVYRLALKGGHLERVTASALWDSAPDWGPR